jgi:hypothetical protein
MKSLHTSLRNLTAFSASALLLASSAFVPTSFSADSLSQSAQKLQKHVKFLSSEDLEGRFPGTDGNKEAAEFIADKLEKYGAKPLNDSYFYEFPVITGVRYGEENSLTIKVIQEGKNTTMKGIGTFELQVASDYTPLAFTKNISSQDMDIVFAGYGITADEIGYDDYKDLDVEGKAVVVFRGSPEPDNPHSKFMTFGSLRYKSLNALEHGASAIIFINTSKDDESSEGTDDLKDLKTDRGGRAGLACLHIKRSFIKGSFDSPNTLDSVERVIAETKKPAPATLTRLAGITLSAEVLDISADVHNVIGVIEGTDPALKDEYLVVGAHFDHIGMGQGGSSLYRGKEPVIHYGADDNASGTSGMLHLTSLIGEKPLRRPVIFMAFNGEEMGLLGSTYYTKNPIIPNEKTIFMLNMDMIGRLEKNTLQVQGTGTSTRWNDLVDSVGIVHDFKITKIPDGLGPSDFSPFYAKDIPVLSLFSGLHSDYHRPTDTWDKINYVGMERILDLGESLLRNIGNSDSKPDFKKVKSSPRKGRGFSVYVGTMPDYSESEKFRITGASQGSPADKAGMREGDVIVKFGKTDVKNIYDYMYSLGNYKAGDTVNVIVLRDGDKNKREELELILESRGKKK